jgi:hypothetical protein
MVILDYNLKKMENQRFKEGDKVYWNAGWNHHDNWLSPEHRWSGESANPVGWMIRGPYDFGYYSQSNGKVILYEEGECNMQDSFCVSECYVIPAKDYEQANSS